MKQQFFHKVSLVSLISLGLCKNFTLEMKMDLSFNFLYKRGRKQTHQTHRLTLLNRQVST